MAAAAALPLSRAVPDADPRAGPAVSRQELPDSKQELGEWTDLAQGANGALSNFQCHFPRLPRHFKVKRDRRSPLCSAFISGKLRSSTTKDGPGCDSSTSPPLRGLRSTSRTLQKGIVTAAQSFTETRPPPQPHEEQTSLGAFRVSRTKFTDPSPFVSFHPIRLHSCFPGFLWGPKWPGLGRPSHYGSTRGVCVFRGGVLVGIAGCMFA